MLQKKVAIRVHRVGAAGMLPVPILLQLRQSHAGLADELAVRMTLNELIVRLAGICSFGSAPILLLPAATAEQQQQRDSDCDPQKLHARSRRATCPDCDHRQHLPLAATGYCTGALTGRPSGKGATAVPTGVTMSDTPKRRLIDQLGSSPTFVAEGCHLTGDVETDGPLVVCGAIRGDGRVGGALSMAARSQWEGEIHAQAAVIAGRVSGKLVVERKLEVGSTAVIQADIVASIIAIAKGAVIDGEVTVTSGEPIVEFEEKRRRA